MITEQTMTKAQGGMIATAYFACYGVGQLLNGFAADRVSPFGMIFAGISLSALANFGMSLPVSIVGLCAFWGFNGLTQSMIWAPIIRIFSQILPDGLRLRACVQISTTIPLGSLTAYLLSTFLLTTAGWESLFRWAAVIMLAVAAIWGGFFFIKRKSFSREAVIPKKPVLDENSLPVKKAGLIQMLVVSGVAIAIIPTALHGMLKDGITTWFPTFLSESFSVSPTFAVLLTSVLPFVNLLGAYLAGYLNSRWLKNEMKTAGVLFGIGAFALLILFLGGRYNMVVFLSASAVATMTMFGVNTAIISFVPMLFGKKGCASAVTGVLNSAAYLGSALSMGIFGDVAEDLGWQAVMLLWLIIAVAGIVLFFTQAKKWHNYQREES